MMQRAVQPKEALHESDISDRIDSCLARSAAVVALQFRLGLWSERRTRIGAGDPRHPDAHGKNLKPIYSSASNPFTNMPKHRRSAAENSPPKAGKNSEPAVPGNLAERRWKLVQQELRYHWKFLSDEDVLKIAGQRDELLRILHEKYSYSRNQADKELSAALSTRRKK